MDKGNWLNARAHAGMVDMNTGQLELSGGIDVFSANGYELHSATASANLKQSIIHGHEPVTGQGPNGTLRADSFHADRDSGLLTLTGHVQMTLMGAKHEKAILLSPLRPPRPRRAACQPSRPAPRCPRATTTRRSTSRRTISRPT